MRGGGGKQERAHLADPELAHNPVCHSSNINRLMQRRGVTDGGVAHSTVSRSQENSHFGRMFDSFFVLNSLQSAITDKKNQCCHGSGLLCISACSYAEHGVVAVPNIGQRNALCHWTLRCCKVSLSLEAISYSFIQKLVIFETPTKLGRKHEPCVYSGFLQCMQMSAFLIRQCLVCIFAQSTSENFVIQEIIVLMQLISWGSFTVMIMS